MTDRFRHGSIYIDGKREARFMTFDYTVNSGDEAVIADDGYAGHSDGPVTTTMSCDVIYPVAASVNPKLLTAILNKGRLDVTAGVINGKIETIKQMVVTSRNVTSDSERGTLRGRFDFAGGPPEVVG